MTTRHYVIWIRPCRSIMPWRLHSEPGGRAVVWITREGVDHAAIQIAELRDHCAIVAPIDLPAKPSDRLTVTLSSGEVREIDL